MVRKLPVGMNITIIFRNVCLPNSINISCLHFLNICMIMVTQGSKLTQTCKMGVILISCERIRKISTSKHLPVRIIHVSQTFGKNFVVSPVCLWKKSYWPKMKLCKWTEKLTSSPDGSNLYRE